MRWRWWAIVWLNIATMIFSIAGSLASIEESKIFNYIMGMASVANVVVIGFGFKTIKNKTLVLFLIIGFCALAIIWFARAIYIN